MNCNFLRLLSRHWCGGGVALGLIAIISVARGDEVDDLVVAVMRRKHLPGLSLAVVRDGHLVKAQGYGLANVETGTPATADTVYKIGSISKQFLAAAVMLLVEDGKLSLDDKASRFLDEPPETWAKITVRQLLSHTSGILTDPPGFTPFQARPDNDVVKSIYATPLLFPPGEKFSYSNAGYFVLGEIIHRVSGEPWSDFIARRIFAPAGLVATRTTTAFDLVPRRANGYSLKNGALQNAPNWIALRPSGAFLSSVVDLAKWDVALSTDAVLKSATREQMWTAEHLNNGKSAGYGFGWVVDSWQGHRRVHHSGELPGFRSDWEHFVDDRLAVIVLLNEDSAANPEKIALSVAGYFVPALAPPVYRPIPDSEPEMTKKARVLLDGFLTGNPDPALFAGPATEKRTAEIKAIGDFLRARGAITSIDLVERKTEGVNRLFRYRLNFSDDSLLFTVIFNSEDKVRGYGVESE